MKENAQTSKRYQRGFVVAPLRDAVDVDQWMIERDDKLKNFHMLNLAALHY